MRARARHSDQHAEASWVDWLSGIRLLSQPLERSGREQRRAGRVVGAIVAVARTIEADETDRAPELVAESGPPRTLDEVTGRSVPVDRHGDRLADGDGAADRRSIRHAQVEVAGLRVEASGDRRQRREALAIEEAAGLVNDAETAIVVDTV